jgi:hypothetical protein
MQILSSDGFLFPLWLAQGISVSKATIGTKKGGATRRPRISQISSYAA